MQQITPFMAQALLSLLSTIDGDSKAHPDWIDAVCTFHEALPEGTVGALQSVANQQNNIEEVTSDFRNKLLQEAIDQLPVGSIHAAGAIRSLMT